MFDTSKIHIVLDKVQTFLGEWLNSHLKQIYPNDWWDRCVMSVLVPEQCERVIQDGAKTPQELDLGMQITVFRGNWTLLRKKFHLHQQLYDDAITVKHIRNKYSHKKSSEDYERRFGHDMETVKLFLKGLGAPANLIGASVLNRDIELDDVNVNTEDTMTFDNMIEAARVRLPASVKRAPWIGLQHGVVPLDTEQKLDQYLAAYGKMHTEKIRMALDSLDDSKNLLAAPVSVFDWGCGQGLATCSFVDWLHKNEINLDRISRVHLIEPSELALKRAQNNIAQYNLESEIRYANKYINDIAPEDFSNDGINTTLHLFSNILDIETVDLDFLSQFIQTNFTGRQIFCCVGPLNNGASRIQEFAGRFGITSEQIEAKVKGRLSHSNGTVSMLTFVIDVGRSFVHKVEKVPSPQDVHSNITLQRLLNRHEPSEDILDRILQFYLISTELEQLKEPNVDRSTPFVMTETEGRVKVSFADNCNGNDQFSGNCRNFALACRENANPRATRWPKDIHFALEVAWDGGVYRLFYTTKPLSELSEFNYNKDAIEVPLGEFSVNLTCADNLELTDDMIAQLEQALHSDEVSLDSLSDFVKEIIDSSALLNTDYVYVSLCDKQAALAQTYAELKRMNAQAIGQNQLLKAFLEYAEIDNAIDSISPEELISTVPMDEYQRQSIAHALNNRVSVVVGPPGCGKTQLLLNLLANALVRSKKVLVASKNNKAVDNVSERFSRFDENGCFLRFGSKKYLSDITCPQLTGLLNLSQVQGYDDEPYAAAIRKFEEARQGVREEARLEESRVQRCDELNSANWSISELNEKLVDALSQKKSVLPEFCEQARVRLDNELQRMKDSLSDTRKNLDDLRSVRQEEEKCFEKKKEEFVKQHQRYAILDGIESSELTRLASLLRRAASDIEYKTSGIHGIWTRLFGKARLAREVLDSLADINPLVRKYLNEKDSNSHINDFKSCREIFEYCQRQAAALESVVSKYREPLLKMIGNNEERLNQLEQSIMKEKAQLDSLNTSINDTIIILSDDEKLVKYTKDKYALPIANRVRELDMQIGNIGEGIKENERLHNDAQSAIHTIDRRLELIEENRKTVFSVEFGQKLVSLVLNHHLHAGGASRAVSAYNSYLPESIPWRNTEIPSFISATKQFLEVCRVVAVTSLSVKNAFPRTDGLFDLLVIDEASQCDVASALPLILRAKQIVIIGDPMQLRHISKIDVEEELAIKRHLKLSGAIHLKYSEASLWDFTRNWLPWCSDDAPCVLEKHYRCHPDIIGYSNKMFYKTLAIGGLEVCTPRFEGGSQGVIWVDVQGKQTTVAININDEEARAAVAVAQKYAVEFVNATIGIVTPFKAQAERINALIPDDLRGRTIVDTVHKFQGDEKDIMIYSPVVTNNSPASKIRWIDYKIPNLVNVAVTRAKRLLVIVGNRNYIRTHSRQELALGGLESYVGIIERRDNVDANNR